MLLTLAGVPYMSIPFMWMDLLQLFNVAIGILPFLETTLT